MMLPATIPNTYRLLPTIRIPKANLGRLAGQLAPAILELVAFGGFTAMCIALMVEFS